MTEEIEPADSAGQQITIVVKDDGLLVLGGHSDVDRYVASQLFAAFFENPASAKC